MGLLSMFFKKPTTSLSFRQSPHFYGFKKYKVSFSGYQEAEAGLKKLKSYDKSLKLQGRIIKMDLISCSNGSDALALYVDELRIGTIFFGEGRSADLRSAFLHDKISEAHVLIETFEDAYAVSLLVRLE